MERHGWSVCVAGPERSSIRARLDAAAVEYLPVAHLSRRSRSPTAPLRALMSLDTWLARNPVDVIHCHSSMAGVLGRLLGPRRGVPVVYSPHCFAFLRDLGPLARTVPAVVERLLAPRTAAFVCVCEAERRAALRLMSSPDRAHRIYNGVPDPPSDVRPAQALLDFKGDGLLVGAMTVLREQKRVDVLIDAIPTVLAAVPDARFAIVGNGPLRPELEQRAGALGLSGDRRFAFFDFDPPSERYLSAFDLYVLSSAWEAMPVGILEALACGVPQIVTRVGGTPEAVTNETGRLVAPKHPDALAGAIVAMLRSSQSRADARAASRARHRALFDADRMVRETVAVYASVSNGGAPHLAPVIPQTAATATVPRAAAPAATPETMPSPPNGVAGPPVMVPLN